MRKRVLAITKIRAALCCISCTYFSVYPDVFAAYDMPFRCKSWWFSRWVFLVSTSRARFAIPCSHQRHYQSGGRIKTAYEYIVHARMTEVGRPRVASCTLVSLRVIR